MPRITMTGNTSVLIENYKGIVEYESHAVRINSLAGIIKITGSGISIKEITSEDIMISGNISLLEFEK